MYRGTLCSLARQASRFLKADWSETATSFDDDANVTIVKNHRDSETLTGFALGGGVEFARVSKCHSWR